MKKHTFTHQGVTYTALSDRGKKVKEEMRRQKRDKTAVPISIFLATSLIVLPSIYA